MQMQIIIDRFLRSEKSHSLNLDSHCRIIMMMLASYMGTKNECWPSYESLMLDCGMAKATLSKSLKYLELSHIIYIKREYKKNNRYSFILSSKGELENESGVQNTVFSSSKQGGSGVQPVNGNNIINNINNNISDFFLSEQDKEQKALEARKQIRQICRLRRKE